MFSLIHILSFGMLIMGMAIVRNCVFELKDTAPAGGVTSGTLKSYNGLIWVSQGLRTIEEGEPVSWRRDVVVEVEKTTLTDTFADGAAISVDLATQKVVSSGGTVVGKARGASAANVKTVRIALNE